MPYMFVFLHAGFHLITGTGTGFKPKILDLDVMESVLMVSSPKIIEFMLFHRSAHSDELHLQPDINRGFWVSCL